MLKIKDNVDLKELEKYGFKYSSFEDWHYFFDNLSISLGDNREIVIDFNDDDYCELEIAINLLNLLYDLIQDGLAEKVDEIC